MGIIDCCSASRVVGVSVSVIGLALWDVAGPSSPPTPPKLRIRLALLMTTFGIAGCYDPLKIPTFEQSAPVDCERADFAGEVVDLTVCFPGETSRSSRGMLLNRKTLVTAGHAVVCRGPLKPLFEGELVIARRDAAGRLIRTTKRFEMLEGSFLSGSGARLDSAVDHISLEELQLHPDYAVLELDSDVPWNVEAPIFATRAPRYGDVMGFGIGPSDNRPGEIAAVGLVRGPRAIARVWTVTASDLGTTVELVPESGAVPAPGWSGAPVFLWEDRQWRFWGVLRSILQFHPEDSPTVKKYLPDGEVPGTVLYRASAAAKWP